MASKKADPYSPTEPTLIARRFDEDREIPEARVKAMLEQVLTSPLVAQTAKLIQSRLGRPLEPFDIWYNGFRPGSQYTEAQLDAMVSAKYPTPAAYQKDIPNLLTKLGFSPERAQYLANHIAVDPSRGAGHAMGAGCARKKRTCVPASARMAWTTKDSTSPCMKWATLSSRHSHSMTWTTLYCRACQHRIHRSAGLCLPGSRS